MESTYPDSFHNQNVMTLDEHIHHMHSVELVGMKRVGINNFLRFYLGLKSRNETSSQLFIPVDLNDLIEREIFPFWRLMFKRIVDAVEKSPVDKETKQTISRYFLDAIQSGDLFLTYDGIRSTFALLSQMKIQPVVIFTRFDRLKDVVTPEFFDNLQGLHAASGRMLSYIFTSFRELEVLAPEVFHKKNLVGFVHKVYVKSATRRDTQIIFADLTRHYELELSREQADEIIRLSGGHVQYLRLLALILHELGKKEGTPFSIEEIIHDERVLLQSEELWESLEVYEQDVLKKVWKAQSITHADRERAGYLWNTGFVTAQDMIFSSLFEAYIASRFEKDEELSDAEFSKKEFLLFSILKENIGNITDRERIVEYVWPEYKEFGVSDWSIDRLVARVRNKLKKQKSPMEIITVRTRGYKLLSA